MQRNLAAVAMRAENNKERFHWRERIAAPFEGNYSKHREHLKRSRAKRHAGGKLDLDQPCNTVVERRKKKKNRAHMISKVTFRGGKITQLADCKVPFYEALMRT